MFEGQREVKIAHFTDFHVNLNYDPSRSDGFPYFCSSNESEKEEVDVPYAPLGRMGCDAPP